MNLGTSEYAKGNDLPQQYRFITPENLQSQINALSKKYRNSAEILWSSTDLTGQVCKCHVLGINYTTGDLFYKGSDGTWTLFLSGSGGAGGGLFDATVEFSVNANPNTVGTTFSPNTPALTTVLYVSTIDFSQWTYNGTSYVTYVSPFWTISGNPSVSASNFIGSINNAALKFRTNNLERLQISSDGRVGIGLTPSTIDKLEVNGSGKFTGLGIGTSGFGDNYFSHLQSSNTFLRISSKNSNSGTSAATGFLFTNDANQSAQCYMGSSTNAFVPAAYLQRTTGSNGFKFVHDTAGSFVRWSTANSGLDLGVYLKWNNSSFIHTGIPTITSITGNTISVINDTTGEFSKISLANLSIIVNFADEEVPAGTIDNSNATFTLSNTPISGSTKLYVRGQRLTKDIDYTVTGLTLVITNTTFIPNVGDSIIIDYRY